MKKTLLLFMLMAGVFHVKAQQMLAPNAADSLKGDLLEKYFKIKPGNQAPIFQSQVSTGQILAAINAQVKVSSCDHMPIAILSGYSKMPVFKLEGSDNMPILKLDPGNPFALSPKPTTPF